MDARLFGDNFDGADGSLFSMRIYSVPEPAATGMLALALGVLNQCRRSRRA